MAERLSITRPDDWHVHFRDDDALNDTVPATARHFARALAMPNLKPALTSLQSLLDYRQCILQKAKSSVFNPYMTFYLNESVNPEDLLAAKQHPFILGAKLYPAGATTHSEEGAVSITALYPYFDLMQEAEFVLQIHGEVTVGDIYEREAIFIEATLKPLIRQFPELRIVLEHISTRAAVEFVTNGPDTLGATITPHHLLFNRNHLLAGGIKPHYYCLPVLKHEQDQQAILKAALSGNPKFFAGTDSAPHAKPLKESSCGCAGIYSAPYAVSLYAQAFSNAAQIHRLDPFMGRFGAEFYHLPPNKERLELIKQSQTIPASLPLGAQQVIPIAAGQTLAWSVHDSQ